MKPRSHITKNTARLLESNLVARESKRVRKERMLHIVWIVGVAYGCLWMIYRMFFGRGIHGVPMLFLWVISVIVYLGLWGRVCSFFPVRFFREEMQDVFAQLPSETRAVKGIILFICPWVTRTLLIIILALLRTKR